MLDIIYFKEQREDAKECSPLLEFLVSLLLNINVQYLCALMGIGKVKFKTLCLEKYELEAENVQFIDG